MDWATVVVSLVGSAIVGPASVGLSTFLSGRLIERQKGQQSKELLETQNTFNIGANSHMAAVAFDKHMGFCQKYLEEVYQALNPLMQGGSPPPPLDPSRLSLIRQEWALWLTSEIDSELEQFEGRVAQLGTEAPTVYANGERVPNNEGSIKRAIAFLRGILRTEELTALRNELVKRPSGGPRSIV